MKNELLKNRILLFAYFLLLILITSTHNVYILSIILLLLVLVSKKDFFQISKKTIISIIFFNLIVSVSFIIMSVLDNKDWGNYIILINLRVFDATFSTFLLTSKVNLFKAFSSSKNLSFILLLSYSQIMMYKRNYENFKLSFRSRNLVRPDKKQIYNFIRSTFIFFFNKSIHNSHEISLAMKSRCFNND